MSSGAAGGVGGGGVLPPAPMALGRKGHKGGGAGPGGYHPPKTPTGRILSSLVFFCHPPKAPAHRWEIGCPLLFVMPHAEDTHR